MCTILQQGVYFLKRRAFLILWISLVIYTFYNTFVYYQTGVQFRRLRNLLGLGLCISRGTASVINISCAVVLLPVCKKMNQLVFRLFSWPCPEFFFYWLESAKSFHMTVAVTIVVFGVVHSISHFANLWNFSRNYDHEVKDINMATYKNENPLSLLASQPGVTGVSLLLVTLVMAVTSLRPVRRNFYNLFWITHHMYWVFLVLLMVHPLSGVLKEEVMPLEDSTEDAVNVRVFTFANGSDSDTAREAKFVPIKSKTWIWMTLPLTCFTIDYIWRVITRNRNKVQILDATYMPGRTLSLTVTCPEGFRCQMGQYVLLQCPDVSAIEWHPFTIVQLPTPSQRTFTVWIRVSGDWTEALEKLLLEKGPSAIRLRCEGGLGGALGGARGGGGAALCVAAGAGVAPFAPLLTYLARYPQNKRPGRIHLIWIVRHESEISWLAELANNTMITLRNANKPDRLHLELYVTNSNNRDAKLKQVIVIDRKDESKVETKILEQDEEKLTLLTPHMKRNTRAEVKAKEHKGLTYIDNNYNVANKYPLIGCRIRRGRPNWDRVFGYWVHLYPEQHLHLYCCGPKKLVKTLRNKCKDISISTTTTFSFIHEGFS